MGMTSIFEAIHTAHMNSLEAMNQVEGSGIERAIAGFFVYIGCMIMQLVMIAIEKVRDWMSRVKGMIDYAMDGADE